jgi:hypothetical protein
MIRTDVETSAVKAFYNSARVLADSVFHLWLVEVTKSAWLLVNQIALPRTHPHSLVHDAAWARVHPGLSTNSHRTNVNTWSRIITSPPLGATEYSNGD